MSKLSLKPKVIVDDFVEIKNHLNPQPEDNTMAKTNAKKNTAQLAAPPATVPIAIYEVGETVFDVIEDLGTIAQRNAIRTIANTTLARSLFGWNFYFEAQDRPTITPESLLGAQRQAQMFGDLSEHFATECRVLGDNPYDQRMTPSAMFDLLVSGDAKAYDSAEEQFEALLTYRDLSDIERAKLRAERKLDLQRSAITQQQNMRERRSAVLAEYSGAKAHFATDQLTAKQHLALFEKVYDKLRSAANRVTKAVGKYENAASDAIELEQAARIVDKASIAFRRRNRDELLTTDDLRQTSSN